MPERSSSRTSFGEGRVLKFPESPIRIVLADDHPIFRQGVRRLLEEAGEIEVVGESANGGQSLAMITELRPDIAVLDVNMPIANGIVVTRQLAASGSATRVVILSVGEERLFVCLALSAGAYGYVLKRSASDNLLHAIRAVHRGGLYLDPTIAERHVMPLSAAREMKRGAEASGAPSLTEREQAILRSIALGLTSKEIAAKLGISAKSIETYKVRACEKLDIRGRSKIVQYALLQGWLQDL